VSAPVSISAPLGVPFTSYQRRLFVFLSVATFFEGYDFLALTQILPQLRAEMGLNEAHGGILVAVINVGTVIAYLLVRQADRWGRRRVLTVTIGGYTVLTFLTGFAPNVWVFGGLQMLARIFLIGEWATSMVIAAEEFPAARRGLVIGIISACGSLGSIVCAGVVPLLLKTEYGWRSVYFVGILPLVILAFARRNLRETQRFVEQRNVEPTPALGLLQIWRTPYRRRMLQLGAIWFATYICTQNAVTFWKEFAVNERSMTDADVGLAIPLAAIVSMPMVFMVGKLIDVVGRRRGAVIVFSLAAVGVFGSYTLHDRWLLTGMLVLGIFGASAVLPVLNAYTTELFPTELRADAFAWTNNLIGRVGYVLSPVVVGLFAREVGWGAAVRPTAIFPIIALVLIFWLLPETRARELEETAAI
jgi:MFS transporter, putative metabolite:H+ symporter